MNLRNLPTEQPAALASLLEARPGQVASKSLTSGDDPSITLLSFAAGESVGEERYFGDTLYYLVSGQARITMPDRTVDIAEGECFMVPARVEHGLENTGGPFTIFQLTLKRS